MIKRLLLGSLGIMLMIAPSVSAQTADWRGFYAGANIGAAHSREKTETSTIFSPTGYFATSSPPAIGALSPQHVNQTNPTGGLQAGYNFQNGNLVMGAEADFGAMHLYKYKGNSGIYPCCTTTYFTVNQSASTDWLLTVRPRVGIAIGRFLPYLTAGMAVTRVDYKTDFVDTFANAHESSRLQKTAVGWTAGVGGEYQLSSSRWSVKGEYLYADFGSASRSTGDLKAFTPPISFPTNTFSHSYKLSSHIVRLGVNYRF